MKGLRRSRDAAGATRERELRWWWLGLIVFFALSACHEPVFGVDEEDFARGDLGNDTPEDTVQSDRGPFDGGPTDSGAGETGAPDSGIERTDLATDAAHLDTGGSDLGERDDARRHEPAARLTWGRFPGVLGAGTAGNVRFEAGVLGHVLSQDGAVRPVVVTGGE